VLHGPLGGTSGVAGAGGGRVLAQYAACPESRWRDLPGVLRESWGVLLAGGSDDDSRLYRGPREGRQEPATIKRYVATVARVHVAAKLLNPCSSEAVRLGLKKMGRETSARQSQAHPLGWKEIKDFIDSAGEGLRADRERAMLCVAYETLARRAELVTLELKDIDFHPDGTGQALIRRGKTDAEGQGRVAYLSRETCRWLKIWLEHAKIEQGAVFRRLIGRKEIGGPLSPGSIGPIFKRVAQWIGLPERFVAQVSGHSTRVGATQDLATLDIDLAAITQAGGWKSTRMPLQYAERIDVARSGMARAAEKSGRDSIT
jgi:integrase